MSILRDDAVRQRVLIVDADRHSFDQLRDEFVQAGCECEVALDLDTARQILSERMMDMIVFNAELPGFDDEAMVEEMAEADPAMRIVIFNGSGDKSRQRRIRRMGASSYLSSASDQAAVVRAVMRVAEEQVAGQ
jgi:DNA-binding NtrC family response regulator